MEETEIEELQTKLLNYFKELGFNINPHLKPRKNSKNFLKKLHQLRKIEQLKKNRNFLENNIKIIKNYYNPKTIDPSKINLELKFVKNNNTEEHIIFKWWNLVWWSLPYENGVGRTLRYILFDTYHDLPFGIVALQSPILKCEARDRYFGIQYEERDYWINQSMYAQRVGALPPYNKIFGGKMVAMSLSSKEIREEYFKKYNGKKTIKKRREIPARLLFISTLSAFGKGKIYENLTYNGEKLSVFVGYTKGAGTFHIPDEMYFRLISLLGENPKKSVFISPSRKMKLIAKSLRILGLHNFEYHNLKRGVYVFPHAENVKEVICNKEKPKWYNFNFESLFNHWLEKSSKATEIEVNWGKIKLLLNKNLGFKFF